MEVLAVRHAWPEKAGFVINRPVGRKDYTFLHFINSVELLVGDKKVKTGANACIFYAPDTPQWFFSEGPCVHNWAHLDPSLNHSLRKFDIQENHIYYPQKPRLITAQFKELEREWFSIRKYRNARMDNQFTEFLIFFSRSCTGAAPVQTSPKYYEQYAEIRKKIILQMEHHWTVAEMAKTANISPSRFYAVYRQLFGTSPVNDLIYARISAAKDRLLTEDITVSRLAGELGYTNVYHFIRQFTEMTGQSPTKYRKSGGRL